ncbi:4Fe-4S binding protein [Prevotella sp. OH937_COT-195]|uniref:4Fe-4S binding protein n=1 Tax=Prevotella sp. OH937_COT-195 TaxID=2491051 RepID=UPI000F64A042|nr:4Fe-4S binding protein [Prevotella sp. OH937_COT-195]RRC98709.1 4Fe-4S binding protein [Prevotella sp. OH937_COT-195]
MKNRDFLRHVVMFLTCFSILLVVSVNRDGRIFGNSLKSEKKSVTDEKTDTIRTMEDGTVVVNTAGIGKDILGYGGQVPLRIYIKEGRVAKVEALDNTETPDFFADASSLLTKWDGKTTEEALAMKVDVVSGATYSSRAIIKNVQAGLMYARENAVGESFFDKLDLSAKLLAGLVVVLMAAVIPLITRNKRYRTLQLVLNVVVLGFWCGTFISYSLLVNYLSNGIDIWSQLVPVIMLVTAFVYPFFGKKNYYCTHVCPCGSLQDLAGKARVRKLKMSRRTVKWLDDFRRILWVVLMFLMLAGVLTEWMDYEMFAAFIFTSASAVVISIAVVFALLSVVVPRPYCRFVCPTGTLFKLSQGIK